ncbi:hypothetical protein G6011_04281 [Alternaria panax]|uniref:Uncharacterized protein n=1 Tax=Alternaria panax TaxID=48097 RepID=A0AAD4IG79_9PLEO|nr:hypothetical protein G6011_04281 [Alternaria panax]
MAKAPINSELPALRLRQDGGSFTAAQPCQEPLRRTAPTRQVALRKTFCVFFVTPSYAQHLLDDDAFLHKALLHVYRNVSNKQGLRIQALCAVVDKLPMRKAKHGTRDEELARRATEPSVAGTGLEGIANVLLAPADSVSSHELPPSDKGAIDFIFAQHVFNDVVYRDTLRLPLSNTVFQTGTPSTMILSTWKTLGEGGGLTLESKTNISHHGIRLIDREDISQLPAVLNVPLLPLTMPRIVQGCMGNIIRGVIGPEGETMQASSELENVVPRFFRSRGQPAQATVAWALVIPEELRAVLAARTDELLSSLPTDNDGTASEQADTWERLWRSRPPLWNTLVSKAIMEGARLHRVLSGGGGWGKKAGLLSLDPVPANEAPKSSKDDEFLGLVDDPEDFESTLTPVVRDGDSIQFFISPQSDLEELALKTNSRRSVSKVTRSAWGWELGTIPSTIDSIPGESWQHLPAKVERIHVHFGFGALTEGPMTLTRHSPVDGGKDVAVNITTIDVPFSRLSASVYRCKTEDAEMEDAKITYAKRKAAKEEYAKKNDAKKENAKEEDSIHEPNTLTSEPSTSAQDPTNNRPTLHVASLFPSHQKRGFRYTSIPKTLPIVREFSSTAPLRWRPRSPPRLTVSELVRKLKIEGHPTTGRLRVRTAKAIMRRLEKFFEKNKTKFREIMTSIRQRDVRFIIMKFRTIMVEAANTVEEADSLLGKFRHKPVRAVLSKERGKLKGERLARNALKKEKKNVQKTLSTSRKENKAEKEDETQSVSSTTTRVPIRRFVSFGEAIFSEVNKKARSAISEVSRLTEEARGVLATAQQYRPRIRKMPVSKLATSQALNQTLGYAIREVLHLTEEARTIMATIQQRKRQSSWRFIRRWGRATNLLPAGPGTSPTDLLKYARRNSQAWQLGIQYLGKEVNTINTLIRQRKYAHRKSVTSKPRITKEERLRVRRIRQNAIRVVRYPSRSWVVQKSLVVRESRKARLLRLRQKKAEKKSKKEGLAMTVEQWLKAGGGYGR